LLLKMSTKQRSALLRRTRSSPPADHVRSNRAQRKKQLHTGNDSYESAPARPLQLGWQMKQQPKQPQLVRACLC
jgi:hypothetical protein